MLQPINCAEAVARLPSFTARSTHNSSILPRSRSDLAFTVRFYVDPNYRKRAPLRYLSDHPFRIDSVRSGRCTSISIHFRCEIRILKLRSFCTRSDLIWVIHVFWLDLKVKLFVSRTVSLFIYIYEFEKLDFACWSFLWIGWFCEIYGDWHKWTRSLKSFWNWIFYRSVSVCVIVLYMVDGMDGCNVVGTNRSV